MKPFLAAIVAIVVVSFAANAALHAFWDSGADQRFSTDDVRLD